MTIQHCDNFSIYHTGTAVADLLDGVYASTSNANIVTDPDILSTGNVLQVVGAQAVVGGGTVRFVMPIQVATVGIACRVWLDHLPTGSGQLPIVACWMDDANNDLYSVHVNTTGRLSIVSGSKASGFTTLFTTAAPVISAGAWYHIECKCLINTSGNISIRVEGVTAANLSANTGSVLISQCGTANVNDSIGGGVAMYVKDLVIWDGQGTLNNDFIGKCIVYSCIPDSDVSLNWTPTGAVNGFSILADSPYDNTKHLDAAAALPAAYVGTMTDLPVNATTVKAVMTFVRAAKSDGSDADLQVDLVSSGTTGTGANRPITTAQTYWRDVQELDPHTAAAWTPTAVNAAQLKLDRTL